MQREMDLIRLLLLKLEGLEQDAGSVYMYEYSELAIDGYTSDQVLYHLDLLLEARLIDQGGNGAMSAFVFKRLTWAGHDFVDSVRDDDVWQKSRKGALAAGGWSLELISDLAKGFIRKKASELTGVEL
jgi:hypothetical protein